MPFSETDRQVFVVLAHGPLSGYALLQALTEHAQGRVRPDLGTLYRALARLESSGHILQVSAPTDPGEQSSASRRYFGLSGLGARVAEAEAARVGARIGLADCTLSLQE